MTEINKNKLEAENKFKNIEVNNEKMVKEYEELAELAERRGNDAKAIKLSLQQVQVNCKNFLQIQVLLIKLLFFKTCFSKLVLQ